MCYVCVYVHNNMLYEHGDVNYHLQLLLIFLSCLNCFSMCIIIHAIQSLVYMSLVVLLIHSLSLSNNLHTNIEAKDTVSSEHFEAARAH